MKHITSKHLPWKKINAAINILLDAIPEITGQIAPFGFAVSEYFYCNRKGPDQDYLIYRKTRAFRYLFAKRNEKTDPPYEPLRSYHEFLSDYQFWPTLNIEMEMTALLVKCFQSIIGCHGFNIIIDEGTYIKQPRTNNISEERILKFALNQTLKRKFANEEDYFYKAKLWGPYFNKNNVDNHPFYVNVFKALQLAGLDFVYRCEYLQFVQRLNGEIDEDNERRMPDLPKYDPVAQVLKSLNNPEEEEDEELDFENAFNEVLQSEPSEALSAYHEVYGCWPDGWPVRRADYL